jgi:hypothetical protein
MYKIIVDHEPSRADNGAAKEGLISFNESVMGEPREKEYSAFLKDIQAKSLAAYKQLLT